MPDPNKKISAPTLDACERNVICASTNISAENIKPEEITPIEECINPCAKDSVKEATVSAKPKAKKTSAKESKEGSAAKSKKKSKTVKEKPAVVNEELCPPGPTCQMARPEVTDPKARVELGKPGCIDFEKCDDDDDEVKSEEAKNTGCQKYEDCKDLAREEKKKLKEQKEKQKKKEKAQKVPDEKPCPK